MLRNPEVAVALVGGKTPEQVQQNIHYVNDLTAEDLAEIDAILDDAPEISWCATPRLEGGSHRPAQLARPCCWVDGLVCGFWVP